MSQEKETARSNLSRHRKIQRLIAMERDKGCCVFHFYNLNKKVEAVDVHHVFGRGKSPDDDREHYTSLVCTCRECHPLPAKDPKGKQSDIISILKKANESPINRSFVHK